MAQNTEYVSELRLENVRKLNEHTFNFKPGFNLVVGENGVGKTSILRALLSTLSQRYPSDKQGLKDDDITHNSSYQRVSVQLNTDECFEYRRDYGSKAVRTKGLKRPMLLSYFADEATCNHFKTKKRKRIKTSDKSRSSADFDESLDSAETWIHKKMTHISNLSDYGKPNFFGSPDSVKEFIRNILSQFSDKFVDFEWVFIPYSTSIKFDNSFTSETKEDQKIFRILKREILNQTTDWVLKENITDLSKIVVSSSGEAIELKRKPKITSSFQNILKKYQPSPRLMEAFHQSHIKISLSPQISVIDSNGDKTLLGQLSDGEQRIFSLFVDIARQLVSQPLPDFDPNIPDEELPATWPYNHEGSAIVLIDEIDVHLHPRWQRIIVKALEDVFPECQFISTTHSPYIIQAVDAYSIISLDHVICGDFHNRGIEEITHKVMGITEHEVSPRYLEMLDAAKAYFKAIYRLSDEEKRDNSIEIQNLKSKLEKLKSKYPSNPAYLAFLELKTEFSK